MFLSKILFLCTVSSVVGYGYDYGSYPSKEEKTECKKLKHYDVTPPTDAHLNRKAKFTYLTKNGRDYVMIQCPADAHMYALISENSGSVFDISGSEYRNTVVLAAGFKVGFVAKCDGKKIMAETTDGKMVRLDKVACIQYSSQEGAESGGATPTVPTASCTSCYIDEAKAEELTTSGASIHFEELPPSDGCKRTRVTCEIDPDNGCQSIFMGMFNTLGQSSYSPTQTGSVSIDLTCDGNGYYSWDDKSNLFMFYCGISC